MMRSLILGLMTLVTLASCSVNVDLKNLEFLPEGEEDTRPQGDAKPPADITRNDNAPVDTGDEPDVEGSANCWEVYRCLIQDEMAWDLEAKKFAKCGATLSDGQYAPAIQDMHDCLDNCVISDTAEEFAGCMFDYCIEDTLQCINDIPGDKSCGEAMQCSAHDCDAFGDEPGMDDIFCLLDCYSGLNEEELEKLSSVVAECFKQDGDMNVHCVPAIQLCYAGSGDADKSCWEMLTCTQECEQCDQTPDSEDCSGTCVFECYEDMSWDAYDQFNGLTLCYIDGAANAFECLDYALQCFEDNLGGQPGTTSCADTLQGMKEPYYAPKNAPFVDKYGGMLGTLWALNHNHINTMYGTLECLYKKWDLFPGYGEMPQLHWKECALNCP
jgi:hypothetical protein